MMTKLFLIIFSILISVLYIKGQTLDMSMTVKNEISTTISNWSETREVCYVTIQNKSNKPVKIKLLAYTIDFTGHKQYLTDISKLPQVELKKGFTILAADIIFPSNAFYQESKINAMTLLGVECLIVNSLKEESFKSEIKLTNIDNIAFVYNNTKRPFVKVHNDLTLDGFSLKSEEGFVSKNIRGIEIDNDNETEIVKQKVAIDSELAETIDVIKEEKIALMKSNGKSKKDGVVKEEINDEEIDVITFDNNLLEITESLDPELIDRLDNRQIITKLSQLVKEIDELKDVANIEDEQLVKDKKVNIPISEVTAANTTKLIDDIFIQMKKNQDNIKLSIDINSKVEDLQLLRQLIDQLIRMKEYTVYQKNVEYKEEKDSFSEY
jgi:hypothetical protein